MPRKKSVRKTKIEARKKTFWSQFKLEESYISLIVGVIVIILIAGGLISFLKNNKSLDTSSLQYKPTVDVNEEESSKANNLPTSYQIKQGDSLWAISEKFYKSGYNWIDIAKANNLRDPNVIHAGNKITIPSVKQQSPTISNQEPQLVQNQITGTTYKVRKGDYLWDIAVRAYGDGFQWVKIASANNLKDPNLIFSGNILKIPR